MSRATRIALILFAVAFAGRLVYVLAFQTYEDTSVAEMERAAANLAREGTLGNVYGDDTGLSAHVAPVYAGFLALLYSLFGIGTPAARMAQELCATLATCAGIAMLPLVSRRLGLTRGAGFAAAVL